MDGPDLLKFAAALIFVLSLMGGLAFILKRIGVGQGMAFAGNRRTLRIVESLPIDTRRRLVLIERENVRHLVILSPSGDTVVESNIGAPDET